MRWPRTLSLYVAREIVSFGALSFIGVTFILISQQLLEQLDQLVRVGVGGAELPSVLLFTLSVLAAHALPIAFAFGLILALGRLEANSEILAMRSLGVGLGALLGPALVVGGAIAAGIALLLADVEPHARLGIRQLLADIALRGTIVQEGRFRGVQNRVIYADRRSPEGVLSGVMIYDVTFAESGSLDYDGGVLTISLRSGEILVDPGAREPERVQRISFDDFEYSFDALSLLSGRYGARAPDELDNDELREVMLLIDGGKPLRNLRKPDREVYELELVRRQAMPLAPLLFATVGVGLGAGRRRSRGLSLVACAAGVFGYYASMTLGLYLAAEGALDPHLACWAPNLLFGTIGGVLIWRVARSAGE